MRKITDRQTEVLSFIESFIKDNSYSPSIREIAEHFQITIKAVQDHIKALNRKGYTKRDGKKPRAIVILRKVVHVS